MIFLELSMAFQVRLLSWWIGNCFGFVAFFFLVGDCWDVCGSEVVVVWVGFSNGCFGGCWVRIGY